MVQKGVVREHVEQENVAQVMWYNKMLSGETLQRKMMDDVPEMLHKKMMYGKMLHRSMLYGVCCTSVLHRVLYREVFSDEVLYWDLSVLEDILRKCRCRPLGGGMGANNLGPSMTGHESTTSVTQIDPGRPHVRKRVQQVCFWHPFWHIFSTFSRNGKNTFDVYRQDSMFL